MSAAAAPAAAGLRDYLALTKPRLNFLAVLTALAAHRTASVQAPPEAGWLDLFAGTAAVAAGCGALNQWMEADFDAHMRRTRERPLPSGRITRQKAASFGFLLAASGAAYLAWRVNALSALLGLAALVSYLWFYTPLKKSSSLATLVGAVPGAIPPLMGWAAARGALDTGALALFLILFFWQMPHFLAISWIYREDYRAAGFPLLAARDPGGGLTGRMALLYALALLPVAPWPAALGLAGGFYFWTAWVLGSLYVLFAARLAFRPNPGAARALFAYSIFYVLALFGTLAGDRPA